MRAHIELGPGPADEPCAQLGDPDYQERSAREMARYVRLLKRLNPNPPEGVRFGVKGFLHDFGTYHEVVLYFDRTDPEQLAWAMRVEGNIPARWPECMHSPIDPATGRVNIIGACTECGQDLNKGAIK